MNVPRLGALLMGIHLLVACSSADDGVVLGHASLASEPNSCINQEQEAQIPSLAAAYRDYFTIGVAVTADYLAKNSDFVAKHFNRLTAEWEMKWAALQKQEGVYDFSASDKIVGFTQEHNMKMTGHTLIWHGDNPSWLFRDSSGNQVSKELLTQRMHDYIFTVMGRYKGKIDNWDVVNEAISDTQGETYRHSDYYKVFGSEEYIPLAFNMAAEADPNAQLWYNDYSIINPDKLAKVITMVRWLKSRHVKLTGVGLQGHYNIYWPPKDLIESAIKQLTAEGLKVKISELDLTIYQDWDNGVFKPEAAKSFTPELETQQAKEYGDLFAVVRAHRNDIAHVTIWGVGDDRTWLDNTVSGRKDYPLLFDTKHEPKKAFWSVVNIPNPAQQSAKQQKRCP